MTMMQMSNVNEKQCKDGILEVIASTQLSPVQSIKVLLQCVQTQLGQKDTEFDSKHQKSFFDQKIDSTVEEEKTPQENIKGVMQMSYIGLHEMA